MKQETLLELITELLGKGESKCPENNPFVIGKSYFIRTVTYHFIGRVEKIIGEFLVLSEASWVADSGRFHEALENGTLSEIEYMGEVFLNIQTITDATIWKKENPTRSK